jgi:nucleosome assembly protein 1-like 1
VLRLRAAQAEHEAVFDEFAAERRALDDKYAARFAPLYARRSAALADGAIPAFWATAFAHCEVVAENITDKDAAALRYLRDVTVAEVSAAEAAAAPPAAPLTAGSYTLTFAFAPNPHFENDALTKTYVMEADDDGELDRAVGCEIRWKPGKDLTHRVLKKKIRGGRGGAGKVITKKEPCDSFFNFFAPPAPPADGAELDEDELEALEEVIGADFELGDTIRNDLIARAVLYYADEVEKDSDDESGASGGGDNDNDKGDGDGDGDGDDDTDEDAPPPPPLPPAQNPEDCKQQ